MSNERIAALEAIDVTAVEALKKLKAEQDVLTERLAQLEERRSSVAEPVYLRVRGDYEKRSRELEQQSAPLKQDARAQFSQLSSLLDRYAADHEAITLDRQEIELRHQLGEFDDADYERRIADLETELAARSEAVERGGELKARFLEAFHSEAELLAVASGPVAAAPPATPAPPPVEAATPAAAAATPVPAAATPAPAATTPTVPGGFRTLEADLASDQTQVMSTMPLPPPAAPAAAATVAAPTMVPPARTSGRPPSETQIMSVLDIPLPPRNSAVPPAASGATVVVRAARLVPQNPEAGKNSIVLSLNAVSIGADGANDVRVGGPGVEAKHAQLTVSMAGYTVVDLGSPHGTRVNAEKIRERLLRDQDVIQIGAARWVFREG